MKRVRELLKGRKRRGGPQLRISSLSPPESEMPLLLRRRGEERKGREQKGREEE